MKNLEVLAYEPSPIGMICLRRRELLSQPGTIVTEITVDHEMLMSSLNNASEKALSEIALQMHPGDGLQVLVGGLGLGYTAHSALAGDRAKRVEVVELLPQVTGWLEQGLFPLSEELNRDDRLAVRPGDVYEELAGASERHYDVILIDVDHSPDERLGDSQGAFYTDEGLARAKQHLAPGGLLGVWSYAESSPFADALRRSFREVRVESVEFHNPLVQEDETNWLFFARD